MSTKIYDAYEVIVSTYDLISRLTELQHQWNKKIISLVAADVATTVLIPYIEDKKARITRKVFMKKFRMNYEDFKKDYAVFTQYPFIDFEGKIADSHVLMKYENSIVVYQCEGRCYFQVFGSKEFKQFLQELSDIILDFHYQNQVDRPDDITAKEYKRRCKIWKKILKDSGVPKECGIVIKYDDLPSFYDINIASRENDVIEAINDILELEMRSVIADEEFAKVIAQGKFKNSLDDYIQFRSDNQQMLSNIIEDRMKKSKLLNVLRWSRKKV